MLAGDRATGRCSSGMAASTSGRTDSVLLRGPCPAIRRKPLICQATQDDGSNPGSKGKPSGPNNKADFSAYWSMKVRNFFSSRKGYLEGADVKKEKRPQVLDWIDAQIRQQREEIMELEIKRMEGQEDPEGRQARLERESEEAARRIMSPLEQKFLGYTLPPEPPPTEENIVLGAVRKELVPSFGYEVKLALFRAQQLVQGIIMAPWTILVAAHAAWQGLFATQKYEMFLMSEGERIWYWRNRTENERWFWEVFAWDRLLFPIVCTVAYQYVTPSNLVWSAVVPAVFIAWQTGKLPGPFNMEFWLIAYFGVYKKCWGDVLGIASALFRWA